MKKWSALVVHEVKVGLARGWARGRRVWRASRLTISRMMKEMRSSSRSRTGPVCVQVDGELSTRLLVRSEVEEVVLIELSVRKTLEGGQCGCRDQANQRVLCFGLASLLPRSLAKVC